MQSKKVLSAFISTLYFLSNVVLLNSQETNIWEERRSQLAALPSRLGPPSNAQPADILRQLPDLGKTLETVKQAPSFDQTFLPPSISGLLEAVSQKQGTVRDIHLSQKQSPFICLIQDVHLNREAQKNISGLFVGLTNKANQLSPNHRLMIGVEGAFGPFDFSRFRAFPDKSINKNVADYFLNENRIAAPSYVGMVKEGPLPVFHGIDDKSHYKANVKAYLVAVQEKEAVLKIIEKEKAALTEKKNQILNPRIKGFDHLKKRYETNTIGLGDYINNLSNLLSANAPDGDVALDLPIEQFLSAYKIEKSLNFGQVDQERKRIVEQLVKKLDKNQLSQLLANGLAYRSGQISYGGYYKFIKSLMDLHQIALSETPAFDEFIRYVLLTDGIKGEELFQSLQRMETSLINALCKTAVEKELMAGSRQLSLIEKLVNFALTPEEWKEYRASYFVQRTSSNENYLRRTRYEERSTSLQAFERFYEEADLRSAKLVENLMARLSNQPFAALLTGGFHTGDVTNELRKRGLSYAVIQPKVTKLEGLSGSDYLTIFSRDKTPLDKLFEGEKLFLSPEALALGAHRSLAPAVGITGAAHARKGRQLPIEARVRRQGNAVVTDQGDYAYAPSGKRVRGYEQLDQMDVPGEGSFAVHRKAPSSSTPVLVYATTAAGFIESALFLLLDITLYGLSRFIKSEWLSHFFVMLHFPSPDELENMQRDNSKIRWALLWGIPLAVIAPALSVHFFDFSLWIHLSIAYIGLITPPSIQHDLVNVERIRRGERPLTIGHDPVAEPPFLKGRIFDPQNIAQERAISSKVKTVAFDLDNTLAYYVGESNTWVLRPGIIEQLKKLKDANVRLVIWTSNRTDAVGDFYKAYPEIAPYFDLIITRENYHEPSEEELNLAYTADIIADIKRVQEKQDNPQPFAGHEAPDLPDAQKISWFYDATPGTKDIALFGYATVVDDNRRINSEGRDYPFHGFRVYHIYHFAQDRRDPDHLEDRKHVDILSGKILELTSRALTLEQHPVNLTKALELSMQRDKAIAAKKVDEFESIGRELAQLVEGNEAVYVQAVIGRLTPSEHAPPVSEIAQLSRLLGDLCGLRNVRGESVSQAAQTFLQLTFSFAIDPTLTVDLLNNERFSRLNEALIAVLAEALDNRENAAQSRDILTRALDPYAPNRDNIFLRLFREIANDAGLARQQGTRHPWGQLREIGSFLRPYIQEWFQNTPLSGLEAFRATVANVFNHNSNSISILRRDIVEGLIHLARPRSLPRSGDLDLLGLSQAQQEAQRVATSLILAITDDWQAGDYRWRDLLDELDPTADNQAGDLARGSAKTFLIEMLPQDRLTGDAQTTYRTAFGPLGRLIFPLDNKNKRTLTLPVTLIIGLVFFRVLLSSVPLTIGIAFYLFGFNLWWVPFGLGIIFIPLIYYFALKELDVPDTLIKTTFAGVWESLVYLIPDLIFYVVGVLKKDESLQNWFVLKHFAKEDGTQKTLEEIKASELDYALFRSMVHENSRIRWSLLASFTLLAAFFATVLVFDLNLNTVSITSISLGLFLAPPSIRHNLSNYRVIKYSQKRILRRSVAPTSARQNEFFVPHSIPTYYWQYGFRFFAPLFRGQRNFKKKVRDLTTVPINFAAEQKSVMRPRVDLFKEVINLNFNVLPLVRRHAKSMNRATLEMILEQVGEMIDIYIELCRQVSDKKHEDSLRVKAHYQTLVGKIKSKCDDQGLLDHEILPKEIIDEVTTLEDFRSRDISSVRNIHTLINFVHQSSIETIFAVFGSKDAPIQNNTRTHIIDLSEKESKRDLTLINRVARTLLQNGRKSGSLRIILDNNELWADFPIVAHSAELYVNLASPDEGGMIRLRFDEGGATRGQRMARMKMIQRILGNLGMHVRIEGDEFLVATIDKDQGGQNVEQLEDILPKILALLERTFGMDEELGYHGPAKLEREITELDDLFQSWSWEFNPNTSLWRSADDRPPWAADANRKRLPTPGFNPILFDQWFNEELKKQGLSPLPPDLSARKAKETLRKSDKGTYSYASVSKSKIAALENIGISIQPNSDELSRFEHALTYAEMRVHCEAVRLEVNRELDRLGFPSIPPISLFGQNHIDKYLNKPIREALARGELYLDRKNILHRNPNYQPIPDLLKRIQANETRALLMANFLSMVETPLSLKPIGSVGQLIASVGQMEVASGDWIVIYQLIDPETNRPVYAAGFKLDQNNKETSLTLTQLMDDLSTEGFPVPTLEEAISGEQQVLARKLLRGEPKVQSFMTSKTSKGISTSEGDGNYVIGTVAFERDKVKKDGDKKSSIYLAPATTQDDQEAIENSLAVITTGGGRLSHAAITTREFGVPSVILRDATWVIKDGQKVLQVTTRFPTNGDKRQSGLWISEQLQQITIEINEGDLLYVDGRTGEVCVLTGTNPMWLAIVTSDLNAGRFNELREWLNQKVNQLPPNSDANHAGSAQISFLLKFILRHALNRSDHRHVLFQVIRDLIPVLPSQLRPEIIDHCQTMAQSAVQSYQQFLEDVEQEVDEIQFGVRLNYLISEITKRYEQILQTSELSAIQNDLLADLNAKKEQLINRCQDKLLDKKKTLIELLRNLHQHRSLIEKSPRNLPHVQQLAQLVISHGLSEDEDILPLMPVLREVEEKLVRMETEEVPKDRNVFRGGEVSLLAQTGGKSSRLARALMLEESLREVGAYIPRWADISTDAFIKFLKDNDIYEEYDRTVREIDHILEEPGQNPDQQKALLNQKLKDLADLIERGSLTPDTGIGKEIFETMNQVWPNGNGPIKYYVRSSAVQEDGTTAAFAGAAETIENVSKEQVLDAVKEAWKSFWLLRGVRYRQRVGIKQITVKPAVMIQEMVHAVAAGVAFSKNPVNGREEVVITSSWGLGKAVVGNAVEPDEIVGKKSTGEPTRFPTRGTKRIMFIPHPTKLGTKLVSVPAKQRKPLSIDYDQIKRIVAVTQMVEGFNGIYTDAEWAIDQRGRIAFLQGRPVTQTGALAAHIFDKYLREKWALHIRYPTVYAFITIFLSNWEVLFALLIPAVQYFLQAQSISVDLLVLVISASAFSIAHPDRTLKRMSTFFGLGLVLGAPFLMAPYLSLTDAIRVSMTIHSIWNTIYVVFFSATTFDEAQALMRNAKIQALRSKEFTEQQLPLGQIILKMLPANDMKLSGDLRQDYENLLKEVATEADFNAAVDQLAYVLQTEQKIITREEGFAGVDMESQTTPLIQILNPMAMDIEEHVNATIDGMANDVAVFYVKNGIEEGLISRAETYAESKSKVVIFLPYTTAPNFDQIQLQLPGASLAGATIIIGTNAATEPVRFAIEGLKKRHAGIRVLMLLEKLRKLVAPKDGTLTVPAKPVLEAVGSSA